MSTDSPLELAGALLDRNEEWWRKESHCRGEARELGMPDDADAPEVTMGDLRKLIRSIRSEIGAQTNAAAQELPAVSSASRQALPIERKGSEVPTPDEPAERATAQTTEPVRDSAKQPASAAPSDDKRDAQVKAAVGHLRDEALDCPNCAAIADLIEEWARSAKVPTGWKLVPMNPTVEMVSAGASAEGMKQVADVYITWQLRTGARIEIGELSPLENAYMAMLDAAPVAPTDSRSYK